MIKTKTKVITEEIDEIIDVICNKCGNSLKDSCDMNFEGLVEAEVCGGYASKIGDCLRVKFSICEDCLLEMFETFKIKPKSDSELML